MKSPDELLGVADRALTRARAMGAEEAEAYVCAVEGASFERQGSLSWARETRDAGIAVRVSAGGRGGQAFAYGTSPTRLDRALEEALSRARGRADAPRPLVLPEAQPLGPPTVVDPRLAEADPEAAAADVELVARTLASAPGVTYHSVSLRTRVSTFALANTRGVEAWDRDAVQSLVLEVRVTRGGVSRTATDQATQRVPVSASVDVAACGADAAARARSALKPRTLERPLTEAVLDATCVSHLLKIWTGAMLGPLAARGRTRLSGRLGQPVAPPHVTLLDAPRGGTGARNQRIDDEGAATHDQALVERGVLRTYLWNAGAAAVHGAHSTGHGYRPSNLRWAGGLGIRTANLRFLPGPHRWDALVAGLDRGVVLCDGLLGAFASNETTGDFSLLCPLAFYVERGSIVHALPATSVAGNVHDMLSRVVAVGREPKPLTRGGISPLHVTGVTCAT